VSSSSPTHALAGEGPLALAALAGQPRSLAARGLGVAVLSRSFVELPGPEVCSRPLSPALRLEVVLRWQGGGRLSPAARAFVDFAWQTV